MPPARRAQQHKCCSRFPIATLLGQLTPSKEKLRDIRGSKSFPTKLPQSQREVLLEGGKLMIVKLLRLAEDNDRSLMRATAQL